jgi:hypothetical protein
MSDVTDRPKRKSVAFADNTEVMDSDGNVKESSANGEDKSTAESHSAEGADDGVDEVTDMFASLGMMLHEVSFLKSATNPYHSEEEAKEVEEEGC